jgi:UDP-glucose 4-epimerase
VSKVAMEQYLFALGPLHGWTTVSLRYANVYGPRQNPAGEAGVVAIFCTRLLDGQPCQINGDGKQTRDYTYVTDVAAANLAALERPRVTGGLNIGTGMETTVNELHERLGRTAGRDVAPVPAPARPGEQRRSCLDAARAARELGWRPAVSLDEGLALTFQFFKKERSR